MYVGKGNSNKQLFLEAVPKKFNRKGYMEVAAKMGLNPKTVGKYLDEFRKTP